jgi:hypothetical protein
MHFLNLSEKQPELILNIVVYKSRNYKQNLANINGS